MGKLELMGLEELWVFMGALQRTNLERILFWVTRGNARGQLEKLCAPPTHLLCDRSPSYSVIQTLAFSQTDGMSYANVSVPSFTPPVPT